MGDPNGYDAAFFHLIVDAMRVVGPKEPTLRIFNLRHPEGVPAGVNGSFVPFFGDDSGSLTWNIDAYAPTTPLPRFSLNPDPTYPTYIEALDGHFVERPDHEGSFLDVSNLVRYAPNFDYPPFGEPYIEDVTGDFVKDPDYEDEFIDVSNATLYALVPDDRYISDDDGDYIEHPEIPGQYILAEDHLYGGVTPSVRDVLESLGVTIERS